LPQVNNAPVSDKKNKEKIEVKVSNEKWYGCEILGNLYIDTADQNTYY